MDKELGTLLRNKFDGSAEGVCASVLSGGMNQVERLAQAFGPKYLTELYDFLHSISESAKDYSGFNELLELTQKAMDFFDTRSDAQKIPSGKNTVEQILNTPMHPDIKDIKSHYRNIIKK